MLVSVLAARALGVSDFGWFGLVLITYVATQGAARALVGEPLLVRPAEAESRPGEAIGTGLVLAAGIAVLVVVAGLVTVARPARPRARAGGARRLPPADLPAGPRPLPGLRDAPPRPGAGARPDLARACSSSRSARCWSPARRAWCSSWSPGPARVPSPGCSRRCPTGTRGSGSGSAGSGRPGRSRGATRCRSRPCRAASLGVSVAIVGDRRLAGAGCGPRGAAPARPVHPVPGRVDRGGGGRGVPDAGRRRPRRWPGTCGVRRR